jgi:hypothetical protein
MTRHTCTSCQQLSVFACSFIICHNCLLSLPSPGSHRVLSEPSVAHHPAIESAVEAVRTACLESGVIGYQEVTFHHKHSENKLDKKSKRKKQMPLKIKSVARRGGWLKYLLLNVDVTTSTVQLTIVWDSPPPPTGPNSYTADSILKFSGGPEWQALSSLLQALQQKENKSANCIDALWVHFNPSPLFSGDSISSENSITSRNPNSWFHVFGPLAVYERLVWPHSDSDAAVQGRLRPSDSSHPCLVFPPFVFRQANNEAFTKIIHSIRHWVTEFCPLPISSQRKPKCLELYGGRAL